MILQRGGEELALQKTLDRFTVRLAAGGSLESLTQQVQPLAVQPIPSVRLVEFQVPPEQLEQVMQLARSLPDVDFASHVYQLEDSPNTRVYLADQVTVQFGNTVNRQTIGPAMQQMGLRATKAVPGVSQAFVFRVTDQAAVNPIKLANRLMRRSDVLLAEPNVAVQTQPQYSPSDRAYKNQWYLHHEGGANLAADSHVFAEAAWDISRGDRSVLVAVADDGFDLNHPDLQGMGKVAFPKDFKGEDQLPIAEGQEHHGTACAGVALGEENDEGIIGVAPGCTFSPIRTTGFLDDDTIEDLFNWVIDSGAAVVSCSWGPAAIRFPLSLRQRAVLTRAATEGRNGKGCIIVFASGNSNRPTSGSINERGWMQDVVRGPTEWLNGFAVHPDVIAVSACTSLNRKSAYSNWGPNISVAAPSNNGVPGIWFPGVGYIATGPQVRGVLPGEGIFTSDRLGAAGYDAGDFTADFGGTSSACPVVAGVAALVLSVNPTLTAREVKLLLQETADKIVDPDPDPQFGFRRGTYDEHGHSDWFGYGKVNAFNAVREAQRRLVPPQPISRRIQQENATAIDIPDFNPNGAVSPIQIADSSVILDIQVTVDIEHEFMGDVEIYLLPPEGEPILLQDRSLGRLTRLRATYTPDTTPKLREWFNRPAQGRWQLKVIDQAAGLTGQLLSWQLELGV
jgi:subtilisin family serine protease/subtilisin-like proprotein convertase family protein